MHTPGLAADPQTIVVYPTFNRRRRIFSESVVQPVVWPIPAVARLEHGTAVLARQYLRVAILAVGAIPDPGIRLRVESPLIVLTLLLKRKRKPGVVLVVDLRHQRIVWRVFQKAIIGRTTIKLWVPRRPHLAAVFAHRGQ